MKNSKDYNYLIDLDGTIYHGTSPVRFAKEFIEYLNENKRKYLMLTNCPGNSVQNLIIKLKGMGIEVSADNILTSGQAAASYLSQIKPNLSVYVIGSDALKEELTNAGIRLVNDHPDYVLVGYDKSFDYDKMNAAVQHIINGAGFVSTNGDYTIPDGDTVVPHTGAISASIEAALNIKPLIIGKPERYILDYALQRLGCDKNDCCIIGDRLDTDIAFGIKNDIPSYLVLTGVTDRKLLEESEIQPTAIFDNLNEIISFENQ